MYMQILYLLVPVRTINKLDTSFEGEGGEQEEEEEVGDNIINRKKEIVKNYGKKMFKKVESVCVCVCCLMTPNNTVLPLM